MHESPKPDLLYEAKDDLKLQSAGFLSQSRQRRTYEYLGPAEGKPFGFVK